MKRQHVLFGEMKLTRPVCFRLPEPMYRKIVSNLGDNSLSDVLREMVSQYDGQNKNNPKNQNNEK